MSRREQSDASGNRLSRRSLLKLAAIGGATVAGGYALCEYPPGSIATNRPTESAGRWKQAPN